MKTFQTFIYEAVKISPQQKKKFQTELEKFARKHKNNEKKYQELMWDQDYIWTILKTVGGEEWADEVYEDERMLSSLESITNSVEKKVFGKAIEA